MNEDKATRYQRRKRVFDVLSLVWTVVLLGGLLATPASIAIRSAAESFTRTVPRFIQPLAIVGVYVALVAVVTEVVAAPLSFYSGFVLEARYGLSRQRLRSWVWDQIKSLLLSVILGTGAAAIVYALIRRNPGGWWLPAGAVFAVVIVGLANVAPILLLPLFYTIRPLNREALRARLLGLADRAGARVLGAYEWGLGEKTRKANAALTGIGGTRRILVSDTMLAEYSDEEIEVVLAHELAHHVHGDIWKGLAFESVLILAGFYAASRVLLALSPRLGLQGPGDIAGLPLLLLAGGAISIVMIPAAHALSRAYERSADRYALEVTKNPNAVVSAMRRLAAQNLAEEHPSKLVQWLFYSHPPIRERIAAAEAYKS